MARSIDVVTLRLFVAVCEEGSIARAAEREAIVASAVSRRIAAIEDDIGAPLLVRGRRGIRPSPAGETLLRQAREILRALDRLDADLKDYASGVQGHVRVVATTAVLAEDLAEDIGTFLTAHPRVQVSTEERVSPEVLRAVRDGAADVGVLWDASDPGDLAVAPYRRDQLCLAVRRDHDLAGATEVSFENVLAQSAVGVAPGGMVDTLLRREAARLGRPLVHRVEVSGIDAAVRFVAAGLGPAVLPREAASGHARADAIAFVPLAEDWARRQFVIVTRASVDAPGPVQWLVEHLKARALA
ncbi:LysR family transcriptional regulator [Achromobacter sp. GG226]|uniref:LysR family transcriptional regulator n=1 Tax=Verticiella alkaliphila TaxID=2779529 RepID=UPI001C0BBB25|nr:LysR family transcriptional regulator [Verticiella sp. GG226]MBU4609284.1 LysR family transcriptional regulator [Verticiella sp. GG226]